MSDHGPAPFRETFERCVHLGLTRDFSTLEALLVAAKPLGLRPSVREWIDGQEIPRPAGTRYVLAVAPADQQTGLQVPSCTVFGGGLATDSPGRYLVFLMGLPSEYIQLFLVDWEAGVEAVARSLSRPLP